MVYNRVLKWCLNFKKPMSNFEVFLIVLIKVDGFQREVDYLNALHVVQI